ncbi:hypothetical protein ACIQC5_05005 [Paenarthrobacter sp. NPDC092416]
MLPSALFVEAFVAFVGDDSGIQRRRREVARAGLAVVKFDVGEYVR